MDRIKVPTNHYYKKQYFSSLQDVFFAWDPDMLEKVTKIKITIYN